MLPDLRHRFPGLADDWVRLDGPAGTLPVDTAIEAMHSYLCSAAPANVGGAFAASVQTGAMVDGVRAAVGRLLGATGSQVVFGASATALMFAYTRALARTWTGGERIVCTQLEHDSNITPWVLAAHDAGAEVTIVPVDPSDGSLDLADLERALTAATVAWVALSGASNLTGFAPDLLHGVEPYRVRPADYPGPERWETGTAAFETIAGIGGATAFMAEHPWDVVTPAETALLARLEDGLRAIPGIVVHAPVAAEGRAPTTIFSAEGRAPEAVAAALAERRIAVWSGDNYACELIDALGLRAQGGVVRAGIVRHTTADDVDALLAALADVR